jgi:lycopene beta-cyclase
VRNAADVILVGGGLANSLIAWRLKQRRPDLRLLMLERGPALGGRHVWSFFAPDVEAEQADWLEPLIVRRWPRYTVDFPGRRRRLDIPYASITAERLHEVVAPALGDDVRYNVDVVEIGDDHVRLAGDERIEAPLVLDGRGPGASPGLLLGWQKFVGREVLTAEPHGLTEPIVMDATVPQYDGYRFVYVLPFDERRLHIEDTYYSDDHDLDRPALRARVDAYAAAKGWRVERVLEEEEGVLPIALGGDIDAFWSAPGPARTGLRAALFHPTTGYSLPDAARLADHIASLPDLTGKAVREDVERLSKSLWRERGFYRLLNRMLFGAGRPDRRYRVLERFYGLPEPLIRRFYRGRMTAGDKARLLVGKPPVPVGEALQVLTERGFRVTRAAA